MLLDADITQIFGMKFGMNTLLKIMRLMEWKEWIFDKIELQCNGWGDGSYLFYAYTIQGFYVEINLNCDQNVIWRYRDAKVYTAVKQGWEVKEPIKLIQEVKSFAKEDLDVA